jgi:type I restriction enzyme M protein
MVEMTAPNPKDVICDPACGTAGFLVAAGEYLRERHPEILRDAKQRAHFHQHAFHGFDFDNTMLRIGSMNMLPRQDARCEEEQRSSASLSTKSECSLVRG